MRIKFKKQQIKSLLSLGEYYPKENGAPVLGIIDQTPISEGVQATSTLMITVEKGTLIPNDVITYENKQYRVSNVVDDLSGLVDCLLTTKNKGYRDYD
ncbi:hypothetical protein [Leclercia sp. AS011]|uniref:hypothetical protein n=1 Tax=Leclercia sp. AS011 TaxID=3081257 RepID=UPI0030165915